jgi:hypothetical protein
MLLRIEVTFGRAAQSGTPWCTTFELFRRGFDFRHLEVAGLNGGLSEFRSESEA